MGIGPNEKISHQKGQEKVKKTCLSLKPNFIKQKLMQKLYNYPKVNNYNFIKFNNSNEI